MRTISRNLTFIAVVMLGASPAAAEVSVDQLAELRAAVQELTATVHSQHVRISQLEQANAQLAQRPPAPSGAGLSGSAATSAEAPAEGAAGRTIYNPNVAASSLSAFNPEIGVLADIIGQASESGADGEGNDTITAREVELILGHPIDPYSRLDVTIAFPELEAAELEEAYITHWGLPAELRGRIGRFKPKLGKAITLHRDTLDTVDEPLVVAQYFGAEGLSRSGVDVTGFLPVPWTAVVHEVTAGVLEGGIGEGGTLLGEVKRRPTYYAHVKNFWDVTEDTNMELGATFLSGSKDADSHYEVHALGLDATLVHYVTPSNKLKWQSEAYLQDRDEAFADALDPNTSEVVRTRFQDRPWGWYSLLDYRLSPRFGIGGRFDYVEPIDTDPGLLVRHGDTAWSGYVTFYQSEFARWRAQVRHSNFALGGDDNTVFVQGTVAIGVHKHQLQ